MVTRRKSALDQSISRCLKVSEAYRRNAASTRQKEEAAEDLGVDDETFRKWLAEARHMGWLRPSE
jgi:hypothetical protein